MARHPVFTIVVVALVALAAAPARADELTDRQQRVRRDRASASAKLDLARASDVKVEAEAARLSLAVQDQSARVQTAAQAEAAAAEEEATTTAKLAEMTSKSERLRQALAARAVQAYVHPVGSLLDEIVRGGSLADASRRVSLLNHVQASATQLDDEYRGARIDLKDAKRELQAVKAVATARSRAETAARDRLAAAEREKQAAHAELGRRISELRAETAALAGQQARIDGILASRAAANAAALAKAKIAPPGKGGIRNPTGNLFASPSATGFIWPVRGPVMSEFGPRWGGFHSGIDIGAGSGTPTAAAKAGVVSYAGWDDSGYGNLVLIDHGGGFATAYAHLSAISATVGQVVSQGQVIGNVGSTGNSTGPHLHFEVRSGGSAQDPRGYESGSP